MRRKRTRKVKTAPLSADAIEASCKFSRPGNTTQHLKESLTFWGLKANTLRGIGTAIAFLLTSLTFVSVVGSRVNLFLDEGIYIHGAQRTLAGEVIYRDWLAFTGPGTNWLLVAIFGLAGQSATVAHGWLAVEIGIVCAAAYWVTAKSGLTLAPASVTLCSAVVFAAFPNRLSINHRWDSLSVGFLSAVLVSESSNSLVLCFAGLLAGFAILCTPPVATLALVLLVFKIFQRRRTAVLAFACGIGISLGIALIVLAYQGALMPMLESSRWASIHYQQANSVPFGFEPDNPNGGTHKSALSFIPVLLPFVAITLIVFCFIRSIPLAHVELLLLTSGAAMILSCYPRWAANQLLFASPFFIAGLLMIAYRLVTVKGWAQTVVYTLVALDSCVLLNTLVRSHTLRLINTQLGEVQCRRQDCKSIELAIAAIKPGESLFVYPYQPILYSLTGGENQTYFDFLQPGMMTANDEDKELHELEVRPPKWIIWNSLTARTVLAIWPNSDRSTLRFNRIEQFIQTHYHQLQPPDLNARYTIALFKRRGE